MKQESAVAALSALSSPHRLALFRLLIQCGREGMPAGAIADALNVPASSLSFHLTQLKSAGLVEAERRHRSIIYRADYPAMDALIAYLTENCCAGVATADVPEIEPHNRKRICA
jgi:ArsR family transcriptional regulator